MAKGSAVVSHLVPSDEPDRSEMTADEIAVRLERSLSARATGISPFRYHRDTIHDVQPLKTVTHHDDTPSPQEITQRWQSLQEVKLDLRHLERNRLISSARRNISANTFDVLRTRLLQTLEDHGWHRVLVTSPTRGCGKTFVATNLALSLARMPSCRTLLVDLELRSPSIAKALGLKTPGPLREVLLGESPVPQHVQRVGENLALCLNSTPVGDAAELLRDPRSIEMFNHMQTALRPDVILYDMPAALTCDDVIAHLPQVDAVLLVVDGTKTNAADITACERLFEGHTPLLGIVLNKAEDAQGARYSYRDE